MQELEADFKKNGGKFEAFKIGNIFDSAVGDYDIQAKHINGKGHLVVSSGLQNCGVIGYSDINAKVFPANTITVDMFGNVFFRDFDYKLVTHARVFSLYFKGSKVSKEIGLYLASCLLFLSKIFSYSNMASYSKIKNLTIILPISANKEISFDYMEQYVRELEAERVRELEAYLIASGLNNYQLTENEQAVLKGLAKHQHITFKIGELFNIKKGTRLTKQEMLKGSTPFIGSSSLNNGCTAYIGNKDRLHSENVITVCYNGSVGESFYQEKEFWASDDVNVLYPKFDLNDNSALFFIALIKKLKAKYGYSRKWTLELMKEDQINVPVVDNAIDLKYISEFIYSIKKQVIKDVIDWKDRELAALKSVI